MIFIQAAVTSGDDAVTEEPASLPELPSTRIEIIVDRRDVRASIPDIRDARPRITAPGTDDEAERIEIPDAAPSGEADGIEQPAEGMNEGDAVIEIPDDGTNVIDAMPEKSARPTDRPARGGEPPDEPIDRTEERMNRNVNRIEVQTQSMSNQGEVK